MTGCLTGRILMVVMSMLLMSLEFMSPRVTRLSAQQPAAVSPLPVTLNRAPVASFTELANTRLVTEHIEFTSYTPGMCVAAMPIARTLLERNSEQDTFPRFAPDPLPAAVHAMGLTCSARDTVTTVPDREVENLLELSVILGQESYAQTALVRWLEQPVNRNSNQAETMAYRLGETIWFYLPLRAEWRWRSAVPTSIAHAQVQALLQRRDAIRPPLVPLGLLGIRGSVDGSLLAYAEGDGVWDPNATIQMMQDLLRRSDTATGLSRTDRFIIYGWGSIVPRFIDAEGFLDPHHVGPLVDSLMTHSPSFAGLPPNLFDAAVQDVDQAGALVPPLQGQFWYNTANTAGHTVWPNPGHVSLLIAVSNSRNDVGREPIFFTVRRLMQKYGARGLNVTVVLKTNGYWLTDGPQTGPVPAAQEAADDSAYIFGHLHLPVTLAVETSTIGRRDDGTVMRSDVQIDTAYGPFENSHGRVVLTDQTGHLLVAGPLTFDEPRLDAYIARALGAPGS